ncbi:aminoglycoside phosphotransferase family protein [Glycomyces salinus]|uniref:aminoglycoside phosphotransferase family protein n=1 Tax=Glycomyces salinus TaxID=980294 RepID=UPI0018EC6BB1|nr:aminoglycoside phosphotransferase family protein [Glycomyces salinus]
MQLPPIPDDIRRQVLEWSGDDGRQWLDSVPGTAERLVDQWGLAPTGGPFEGGTHSYVLPVDRDGEDAVLKVIYRDEENAAEPTALRDYDGDGAVRLYEYEAETGAMLLERVMPGTELLEHDFGPEDDRATWRRRVESACGLYRRLWRAPGQSDGFPAYPLATDLLADLERHFEKLESPWRERGQDLCRTLADPGEVGIANRDTHLGNIIASDREPWLLIDPKPYLAERAFDAGYFVFRQLEYGIALGTPELVRIVAENLGADRERVKAWAAVRALAEAAEAGPGEYHDSCAGVVADIERA